MSLIAVIFARRRIFRLQQSDLVGFRGFRVTGYPYVNPEKDKAA
jgi:hypothetical protein